MKNVLGTAGQIAGKTNKESVTGLFKGITGKQDVKNVLSGVAVSLYNVLMIASSARENNVCLVK